MRGPERWEIAFSVARIYEEGRGEENVRRGVRVGLVRTARGVSMMGGMDCGFGGRFEMKGMRKWDGRRAFVRTQVRIGVARAWAKKILSVFCAGLLF